MSNMKLQLKILHLKELKINGFEFRQRDQGLHLFIKPYKNGCRCPECRRRCRIVRHATEPRCWTNITVIGLRAILHYQDFHK